MAEAVIIDCLRTAVGAAHTGALRDCRPDDLAAAVITELLGRHSQVPADEIDEVILGCAFPEAEAGMNLARNAVLLAGLPEQVPGMTVSRMCASGLQAIATGAEKIRAGAAHIVIAGGVESMSLSPWPGRGFAPNPKLVESQPDLYLEMALATEALQRRYRISREDCDAFAFESHQNAARAQAQGRFAEEIVPFEVRSTVVEEGRRVRQSSIFGKDEWLRDGVTREVLAAMPPLVDARGAVTEGNSAPAGDGAAVALLMSERRAAELGLRPRMRFAGFAAAGVPPLIGGIAPVVAIPKALELAGVKLYDIDAIELNEGFAAQALAVIRQAGLDIEKLNLNGGSIALGDARGATGARLTATLLREMERRKSSYGLVAMSAAGGHGAAAVFARP